MNTALMVALEELGLNGEPFTENTPTPPQGANYLLLENGGKLLLENGDSTLQESSGVSQFSFGNGLKFDGVDDYVSVNSQTETGQTKLSINIWLKDLDQYNGARIGLRENFSNIWLIVFDSNNEFVIAFRNSSSETYRPVFTAISGKSMITVVYDGGQIEGNRIRFYIDGSLKGTSNSAAASLPNFTNNIELGGNSDIPVFGEAIMNEIAIHNNYLLSDSEIEALYNNGGGADYSETVEQPSHYFKGDIEDGDLVWVDNGTKGVDGVLNNFSSPPVYAVDFNS